MGFGAGAALVCVCCRCIERRLYLGVELQEVGPRPIHFAKNYINFAMTTVATLHATALRGRMRPEQPQQYHIVLDTCTLTLGTISIAYGA